MNIDFVVSASIENLTKEMKSENNKKEKPTEATKQKIPETNKKEKSTEVMKQNTRLKISFVLSNSPRKWKTFLDTSIRLIFEKVFVT